MESLEAVCFDLDGVICDTSEYHYQAWQALAGSIGIKIDRSFNERLKGRSREDSLRDILRYGGKLDQFNQVEFEHLAAKKNELYLKLISGITHKDLFPGIEQLLMELQQAQIKIALASASKNAPLILNKLAISDYFQGIADPAKVASGKPAPDLYLEASLVVQADPKNCVGIEDAIVGIEAIIAAQMTPIGVGKSLLKELNQLNRKDDTKVTVVESTSELTLDFLESAVKNS